MKVFLLKTFFLLIFQIKSHFLPEFLFPSIYFQSINFPQLCKSFWKDYPSWIYKRCICGKLSRNKTVMGTVPINLRIRIRPPVFPNNNFHSQETSMIKMLAHSISINQTYLKIKQSQFIWLHLNHLSTYLIL